MRNSNDWIIGGYYIFIIVGTIATLAYDYGRKCERPWIFLSIMAVIIVALASILVILRRKR